MFFDTYYHTHFFTHIATHLFLHGRYKKNGWAKYAGGLFLCSLTYYTLGARYHPAPHNATVRGCAWCKCLDALGRDGPYINF